MAPRSRVRVLARLGGVIGLALSQLKRVVILLRAALAGSATNACRSARGLSMKAQKELHLEIATDNIDGDVILSVMAYEITAVCL
jgi:hypothetical protein